MTIALTPDQISDLGIDLGVSLEEVADAALSVGANPAFYDPTRLTGVPCVLTPRLRDGKYLGTPRSPGFVVELPVSVLDDLGFSYDEIYTGGLGCNPATHVDHEDPAQRPVCEACLYAAGNPEDFSAYEGERTACWSCALMWDEQLERVPE